MTPITVLIVVLACGLVVGLASWARLALARIDEDLRSLIAFEALDFEVSSEYAWQGSHAPEIAIPG